MMERVDVPVTALTRKVGFPEDFKGDKRWKISPTQVRAWMECPRKWGFRYLDGIQTPQTAAAALGSAVHSVLETYLNGGEWHFHPPDRETKIAMTGLKFLPGPGEAALVEKEILFDWDGLLFRGFIDVAWEPEDGPPVVSDHKTSSDPAKWGLTAAELPTDVQGLIYGVFGLDHWGEAVLGLQWTYFRTRGAARSHPVRARITREETRENFKKIVEPVGRAIVDAVERHKTDGLTGQGLAANPNACGMYGGCHFAGICERTQDETLTAIFGDKQEQEREQGMGLKDLLEKKKKKAPPRVDELQNVVSINPPEAPASDEVAREVSQVVGQATGNAAKKKAKGRTIATAAAGETDPKAAREKAEAALEKAETVEAPAKKPSPTQAQILFMLTEADGTKVFAANRPKATEEIPFAHGRTLGAMERAGLVDVEDADPGFRRVTLTELGESKAPKVEPVPAPPAKVEPVPAPPAKVEPVPAPPANLPEHSMGVLHFDDEVTVEFSPRARLMADLLLKTLDVEKAEALMDAFDRRFQGGNVRD